MGLEVFITGTIFGGFIASAIFLFILTGIKKHEEWERRQAAYSKLELILSDKDVLKIIEDKGLLKG